MAATKTIQVLLLIFLLQLSFQQSPSFLPNILDEVGYQVTDVAGTVSDGVSDVYDDATGEYDDLISDALEDIWISMQGVVDPLPDSAGNLVNDYVGVAAPEDDAPTDLVTMFGDITSDAVDAVGDVASSVGDAVGDAASSVGDVASDAVDAIGGAASDVGDAVGGVVSDIGDALSCIFGC